MGDLAAIIVAICTGVGAAGGAACKYYYDVQQRERQNTQEQRIQPQLPRSNSHDSLDRTIGNIVREQMNKRDSDTETEIDIHVNIHLTHEERKSNELD